MSEITKFKDFNRVVEEILELRKPLEIYRDLGKAGVNVDLNDLIYTSRGIYQVFPDKAIKKVLLYQGERHFRITDKLDETIDPNFHIYKCDIVKKQVEQKAKRFKTTTRKDGSFFIRDFKFPNSFLP